MKKTFTKVFCDRCGDEMESDRDAGVRLLLGEDVALVYHGPDGSNRRAIEAVDICTPCAASFERWWDLSKENKS